MRRSEPLKCICVVLFLAFAASEAMAEGNWDRAGSCFNTGDFACAFAEAKRLALDHRIAVGHDHRTTDSMTFYQRAKVEYLASANLKEIEEALLFSHNHFRQYRSRLPFSVVFGYLSYKHARSQAENAIWSDLDGVICEALKEAPQPSWRKLVDTNPLTKKAKGYFRSVMTMKPSCGVPSS